MSKQNIRHDSVFFLQFYDLGQKSLISDSLRFLWWSTYIQAGWQILHREKISFTSIGSCQRILNCKNLHCRLIGILMLLLTHVVKLDKEVKIVKEVERSDSLWRFACGNVFRLVRRSSELNKAHRAKRNCFSESVVAHYGGCDGCAKYKVCLRRTCWTNILYNLITELIFCTF